MSSGSRQDWVGRNRPPRVQIKYEVYNSGVREQRELPLKVGVLADLSGKPLKPLPPLSQRRFTAVSRDNFGAFLKAVKPRVAFQVPNVIENDGTELSVKLEFESMKDFEPDRIAERFEPLRRLLELRAKLKSTLDQMTDNPGVKVGIRDLIAETESRRRAGEGQP